jgi:hypothetical protein
MTGIYANMGEIARRLSQLEEENARMKEQIRLLERERFARFMGATGTKIHHGVTEEAIAKDAAGDVELHDSGGGTGTVVEVTNKLGSILITKDCYVAIPEGYTNYHLLSGEC